MLDEHTAKKVRRDPKEGKKTRTRLVSDEGGIQRNCLAVGICDLLRSGGEAGSYDEKSVGILEGDAGGSSVDGQSGGTLEAAAADGEGGAIGRGNTERGNGATRALHGGHEIPGNKRTALQPGRGAVVEIKVNV